MTQTTEIGRPQMLRVATVWGTTILGVRLLERGQSFELAGDGDAVTALPDGVSVSPVPIRAGAGGWELDARGVVAGVLKLRGRDENPATLAEAGPIPILPGDYGLLQYGLYSLFFQYTTPGTPLTTRFNVETLALLALLSSGILHAGGLGLLRALMTPPPLNKPLELTNPDEYAALFGLTRPLMEEPPPPQPSNEKNGGGSGVKDPGAKDKKKQGGGQKIVGAEGKAGMKGKEDHTELPGDIKPVTHYGGLDEVLTSDTGKEMQQALKNIDTVANALGGLNSANVVLGSGPGTGLKGTGSGGGGTGAGVMFGSGTMQTGWGPGTGGGYGAGSGGPGGPGRGGNGLGGSGGGTGTGNGPGNGPGERGVAANTGGPPTHGGLSPEQVRRVVVAHTGALRACYEFEAQKDPTLRGGVTVAWTIDQSGAVTSASLAGSTIHNPRVEGCVVRQVKTFHFPSSDGSTQASFPFKFGVGG
jgi:hypothetical protein